MLRMILSDKNSTISKPKNVSSKPSGLIHSFKNNLIMDNNLQPTFANGKICYLEIPALDINKSYKFYQNVFGWNIRDDGDGNVSFDDTVGQVSGMWVLDRQPAVNPGVLISIMVDRISDTLKSIVENGGKVVQIPDGNTFEKTARFSDPAGNLFCLYQDQ